MGEEGGSFWKFVAPSLVHLDLEPGDLGRESRSRGSPGGQGRVVGFIVAALEVGGGEMDLDRYENYLGVNNKFGS